MKNSRRPDSIHGFNDSFFLRSAMSIVDNLFDGSMDYLQITMKMSLHDVVMTALQNAGLLSGVVFHGGTCLQRMYNWSRLSEDLDFANTDRMDENRFIDFGRKFDSAIRSELKRLGFSDDQITVKEPKNLAWPAEHEPAVRKWAMGVNVGSRNMKQVVNIELVNMPSYNYAPQVFVPLSNISSIGSIMVNVEPLNIIFNDKAISIIQRDFLKYRDIYDVGLLSDRQSIDREIFLSKMEDRSFTAKYVLEKLGNIRESLRSDNCIQAFSNEMSRFVMPEKTPDVTNPAIAKHIISKSLSVLEDIECILLS